MFRREHFFKNVLLLVGIAQLLLSNVAANAFQNVRMGQLLRESNVQKDIISLPNCGPTEKEQIFKEATELLKGSLNLSVDPCDDFYNFACGNWATSHPRPASREFYDSFVEVAERINQQLHGLLSGNFKSKSKAISKMKHFYDACVDEEAAYEAGLKQLLRKMKEISPFPAIEDDCNEKSLTQIMIDMKRKVNANTFFPNSVDSHPYRSTEAVLEVNTVDPSITRDFLIHKDRYPNYVKAYRTYLIETIEFVARARGLSTDIKRIEKSVDGIIEFETQLAILQPPTIDRRNETLKANFYKLSTLDELAPAINWSELILAVTPESVHEYFKSDPEIKIDFPKYMTSLSDLLRGTKPEVIMNYLQLKVVESFDFSVGAYGEYKEIKERFDKVYRGTVGSAPRYEQCLYYAETSENLRHIIGAIYARYFFDKETKGIIKEMSGNLKMEFMEMLNENDWMDKETKKRAMEKVETFVYLIAYPDFVLNDWQLDTMYENLNFTAGDDLQSMLQHEHEFAVQRDYHQLLEPVRKDEYTMGAALVNANYIPKYNSLVFPAGILQAPYFHPKYPMSMNYGSIGMIIGHEITHGFDTEGQLYDADGNLKSWWNANTQKAFDERVQCMIDQYSAEEVPGTGMKADGKLTIVDNMADNGGLREALRAFKKHMDLRGKEKPVPGFEQFNDLQLFFIAFAQSWCGSSTVQKEILLLKTNEHANYHLRTNIPVRNEPEFAKQFNCPLGSAMNPVNKCVVW